MAAFAGAVLTGGSSRRMGHDKALLLVHGRPLAVVVTDALRQAGAAPIFCVGGDRRALASLGLSTALDEHPGEGPLGGIITALAAAGAAEAVAVLAVDLPMVDHRAVRSLVEALDAQPDADLVVPVVDGHRQWLHAVWRTRALATLEEAFAAGERSVHRAASGLHVVDLAGLDPVVLADADRPTDLPDGAAVAAVDGERH